jgi:putative membrane protein insertion efficiency factor
VIAIHRAKPHFAGHAMLAKLFVWIIRGYQRAISPLLGNVCRFEPSCSRYAVACLESHGALRGSLLSFVRLCKCHPFHPGGIDLPPTPKKIS